MNLQSAHVQEAEPLQVCSGELRCAQVSSGELRCACRETEKSDYLITRVVAQLDSERRFGARIQQRLNVKVEKRRVK